MIESITGSGSAGERKDQPQPERGRITSAGERKDEPARYVRWDVGSTEEAAFSIFG